MTHGPRSDMEKQHQEGYVPLPVDLIQALKKRRSCYRQAERALLGENVMDYSDHFRDN